MQHSQGQDSNGERGQSAAHGSPTASLVSDSVALPPSLSPPVSQQLASELPSAEAPGHAGSLQQAVTGMASGNQPVAGPMSSNQGLGGPDELSARMARFQLGQDQFGGRSMQPGQQLAGVPHQDPRLTSAGPVGLSSGAYALSPPPPPPLHMAAAMGPAFADQLRYRDAQIAKLAGTLAHYRGWAAQVQARYQMFNAEAARPARRIYVGGLPAGTQELELRQYVNDLLIKTGGAAAPGFPINSCKLYPEKNFAFLEFRSVEEASNCMAFDGIAFRDCYLKIRRPNNYEPDVCIMLGPPDPDPTMDLSALEIVKTVVMDSPNKLFVGGLPCDWSEDQVKDILLPFGTLKAFNLVMDKNTGNSKGYAFCEYNDMGLTNYVIQALNGKPVGNKFLTVKRAVTPATSPFGEPPLS